MLSFKVPPFFHLYKSYFVCLQRDIHCNFNCKSRYWKIEKVSVSVCTSPFKARSLAPFPHRRMPWLTVWASSVVKPADRTAGIVMANGLESVCRGTEDRTATKFVCFFRRHSRTWTWVLGMILGLSTTVPDSHGIRVSISRNRCGDRLVTSNK